LRQWPVERVVITLFVQQVSFEQCFGQLLHEQGNTVRALDDAVDDEARERLVMRNVRGELRRLVPAQPAERQTCYVGLPSPRWVEFRTRGDDHEYRLVRYPVGDHFE